MDRNVSRMILYFFSETNTEISYVCHLAFSPVWSEFMQIHCIREKEAFTHQIHLLPQEAAVSLFLNTEYRHRVVI